MGSYRRRSSVIDKADYISEHRDKVMLFINKVCDDITYRLGNSQEIVDVIRDLRKRGHAHDMDKLTNYRTLELYTNRDDLEDEVYKMEYNHKIINRHHPQYFIEHKEDMNIIDFIEFAADIFSSTLLRGKKAYEELEEEQETANFTDYLYRSILVTYAKLNYGFRMDVTKTYNYNIGISDDLVDIFREVVILKKRIKFINSNK